MISSAIEQGAKMGSDTAGERLPSVQCHWCGRFMKMKDADAHYQPDAWGPLPGFDYKEESWWEHAGGCPKRTPAVSPESDQG